MADEDEFLLQDAELSERVWRLGALSEGEKNWLYERAALVIYPSLSEGFGLVPFEAAARNVPCLSTRAGALDEVLPLGIPTIDLGDIEATARLAVDMSQDIALREDICKALNAKALEYTWAATADRLLDFFWAVIARPPNGSRRVSEALLRSAREGTGRGTGTWPLIQVPLSWARRHLASRPEFRRAVLPPSSLRSKLGIKVATYVDSRSR